jgi:hypothetical protein
MGFDDEPAVPEAPALPEGNIILCGIEFELPHLRALLASQGLSIIGAKDRAVLEACAAFPTAALTHDATFSRNEMSDLSLRWTEAELDRREKP